MSKNLINTLTISGSVAGLFLLSLAIAPEANACDACGGNMSNGSGSISGGYNGAHGGGGSHGGGSHGGGGKSDGGGGGSHGNMSNGSGGHHGYNMSNGGGMGGGGKPPMMGGNMSNGGGYGMGGKPPFMGGNMSNGGGYGMGGKSPYTGNMSNGSGSGMNHPWHAGNGSWGANTGGNGGWGGTPTTPTAPTTPTTPTTPVVVTPGNTPSNPCAGGGGACGGPVYAPGSAVVTGINPVAPGASTGYNGSIIGLSQQFQQRLLSAQSAYEQASARLAAAETAQPVASSGPVRYARGPVDLASCGCLNPDTATGPSSTELASAKAAEAEAAAELAKAKAEARQFLESVKNNGNVAGNATTFSPLW